MIKKILRWLGFHIHEWKYTYHDVPYVYTFTYYGKQHVRITFEVRTCSLCGKEKSKNVREVKLHGD